MNPYFAMNPNDIEEERQPNTFDVDDEYDVYFLQQAYEYHETLVEDENRPMLKPVSFVRLCKYDCVLSVLKRRFGSMMFIKAKFSAILDLCLLAKAHGQTHEGPSPHHYAIQADCDVKATNIILQGLSPEVYALFLNTLPPEWSKFMTDVKLVRDLHTTNIDQLHACRHILANTNYQQELRNSLYPQQQATLMMADYFTTSSGAETNFFGLGYQVELHFSWRNALAEVHNPANVDTNMINQAVQAMPSSEQSSIVNHSETKITSDSNIIPYSQYVIESQQADVQNSNSSAQQDALILSVIEQLKT
ncbi:hypothetical protein Tco_1089168 [Tanacetum coccineum]